MLRTVFSSPSSALRVCRVRTLGHYKIIEQLGAGGVGVVYQAQQDEPVERRVAIKITKTGVDSRG